MNSFIALLVVTIVCLVYARLRRDHRVYTKLMFGVLLGFIVGIMVKHSDAKPQKNIDGIEIVSNPTQYNHSAVVWTDDYANIDTASKDTLESDTITIHQNSKTKIPTNLINTEIQDDS